MAKQELEKRSQPFHVDMDALRGVAMAWYDQRCDIFQGQKKGVQLERVVRESAGMLLTILTVVPVKNKLAHHGDGESDPTTILDGVKRVSTDLEGKINVDIEENGHKTRVTLNKNGIASVREEENKREKNKTGIFNFDGKKANYKGVQHSLSSDSVSVVRRINRQWEVEAVLGESDVAQAVIDEGGVSRIARILNNNSDNSILLSSLEYDRAEKSLTVQNAGEAQYRVQEVLFAGGKLEGTLRFHTDGVMPVDFTFTPDGMKEVNITGKNYKVRYGVNEREVSYKSSGLNIVVGNIEQARRGVDGWVFLVTEHAHMAVDKEGLHSLVLYAKDETTHTENGFSYVRETKEVCAENEKSNIHISGVTSFVKTSSGWEVKANTSQRNLLLAINNEWRPSRLIVAGIKDNATFYQVQYDLEKNSFSFQQRGKKSLEIADVATIDIEEQNYFITAGSGDEEKIRYGFDEEGLDVVGASTWIYKAKEGTLQTVADKETSNIIRDLEWQGYKDGKFLFTKTKNDIKQTYHVDTRDIQQVVFENDMGSYERRSIVFENDKQKLLYTRNSQPLLELVGVTKAYLEDEGIQVTVSSDTAEAVVDVDIDGIKTLTVVEKDRDVAFTYDRETTRAVLSLGDLPAVTINAVRSIQRKEARISFEGELYGRRVIIDIDNVTKQPRFVFAYKTQDGKKEKVILKNVIRVYEEGEFLSVLAAEENNLKEALFDKDGIPVNPFFPHKEENEIALFDQDIVSNYRKLALPTARGISIHHKYSYLQKLFDTD